MRQAGGLILTAMVTMAPLCAALADEADPAPAPPTVQSFSPQGSAKDVRQARARFSAPMVALGDPRLPDPFRVDCPAPGKGRWADTRNWVYDFDADLPGGVRCRFELLPGTATLDGRVLGGRRVFDFDTGGPAIRASLPGDGAGGIDEEQVFLLRLDAVATPEAIAGKAWCVVDGVAEKVPADALAGAARSAVLAERAGLGYAYYQLLSPDGAAGADGDREQALAAAEAELAVLKCRRRLPPDTQVKLVWGAGIAATSGVTTARPQTLAFRTRPAFTARVECSRVNAAAGCLPMRPIRVDFSAPVARSLALSTRLVLADGTRVQPDAPEAIDIPNVSQVTFSGPFPEGGALTVVLPDQLVDDAGRRLENLDRFPLAVEVDEYPPLVKFAADFGILEAAEGGVLPVTLRNVEAAVPARKASIPGQRLRIGADPEAISTWLRAVVEANRRRGEWFTDAATGEARWREDTGSTSVFELAGGKGTAAATVTSFEITKPGGARPAEVIGIPLGEPGLHVVELASERLGAALLGRSATRYVSTAALVTNLAVHFKWGRESSRVWVTRLDDGSVVRGARVLISSFCDGRTRWDGHTGPDGQLVIGYSLGEPHSYGGCEAPALQPLLVVASLGDDTGFTQSAWTDGIEPYSFGLPTGSAYQSQVFHTVLDRPLFRAGEVVSMKHFLRRRQLDGIGIATNIAGPRKVVIVHGGSNQRYESSVEFDADGVAVQQWTIPREAKLGSYDILIADEDDGQRSSGSFQVQEYRLPTMRASVQGPARPQVGVESVPVDVHVAYLAGGGAAQLPVTLRTAIEPASVSFDDYADFSFGGEAVVEGIERQGRSPFDVDAEGDGTTGEPRTQVLPLTLDAQGAARVTIPDLPAVTRPARLVAELEYADPKGEVMTTATRIRLLPSTLNLGIRREGWVASDAQLRFKVVALDLDGKPVARQPVTVTLYRSSAYSFRKRLIGGFYAYETLRETSRLDVRCEGRTDRQGILACDVAPGTSGEIKLRAETRDDAGRLAGATTSIWVAGADDWWFGGTEGDRMDVLPEQKEYEPGQVARFQVRMPFRSATALVTVEREGVIDSFVRRLSGREPVIEVPIGDSYAPNVFVSVLAVRGRVGGSRGSRSGDGEEITALVDLNKPAYRLGMAQVRVGWRGQRLDVTVEPARDTYRVRDTAEVKLRVRRADGGRLPAGAEVALAAVDEALLDLAANPSWQLLDAMMGERGLEVWTSTAQMQVVGKRHYGRKAVAHGGGGGRDRARELFDSLLAWQARVTLDGNGEASVRIPLNDSLSAFRIVAVAHAGASLFGTGSSSITTTQDLMLLSGLPPLVREGDRFAATFTLRNTTTDAMTVEVTPVVQPAVPGGLTPERVLVPAGEARDLAWSVEVPPGSAGRLSWDVSASAGAGQASDRIRVSQAVMPVFPVRTYQATLAQLTGPLAIPVERPDGAIEGRGGLDIDLRARLGDSLGGVREYMSGYPYTCIEQQVSRAVALGDAALWKSWMQRLPAYLDRDGLVRYFPSEFLPGDDALTAYVLAIADESGNAIPEDSRQRMIEGLAGFVQGRVSRGSVLPTADLGIRKLASVEALARHGVATPELLDSVVIEPELWPTSAVLDWLSILERVEGMPARASSIARAESILQARLDFQGTTLGFSTERTDALWWLMVSTDSNAARVLLAGLDRPGWREDVPRLVRGLVGRQQRGHWNTTVANAWGTLALEKFSRRFESEPVTGSTTVRYGASTDTADWSGRDAVSISQPWQAGRKPVDIEHEGSGRPWLMLRAQAALPPAGPLSSGYRVERTVTAVTRQVPGRWTRGDVARVRIEVEAQSDMTWVVVDDPVPAGASILGSGLGGQSELLGRGERGGGQAWPAFTERRFDGFRAYYRYVPKGRLAVEYTVRFNNPGTFLLPPTRVEAMYAPEMFGESPNEALAVAPAP